MKIMSDMIWKEIERDENGFATFKCLNEMFSKLPILIVEQYNEHGVEQFYEIIHNGHDLYGWRGDIELHPRYTHYLHIESAPIL